MATKFGNSGKNRFVGTSAADSFFGLGGNDILIGNGGNDKLIGGDGNDRLFGGAGRDRLDGGRGRDFLDGGSGADVMIGGPGNDVFVVDSLSDSVRDSGGIDTVRTKLTTLNLTDYAGGAIENIVLLTPNTAATITGNASNNTMVGNSGSDNFLGLDGNDTLIGNAGADNLDGGIGNDTLLGGDDADTCNGREGDDLIRGGRGGDTLSGGFGADSFAYLLEDLNFGAIDHITDYSFMNDDVIDLSGVIDPVDNADVAKFVSVTRVATDSFIFLDLDRLGIGGGTEYGSTLFVVLDNYIDPIKVVADGSFQIYI